MIKVFTNGCFDLIHMGHVLLLKEAKSMGDQLIVGLNSDESVRRLKGYPRPLIPQDERLFILKSIKYVDDVRLFEEDTPEDLIAYIKPDILVKGCDWRGKEIAGQQFIKKLHFVSIYKGYSTTKIINSIRKFYE